MGKANFSDDFKRDVRLLIAGARARPRRSAFRCASRFATNSVSLSRLYAWKTGITNTIIAQNKVYTAADAERTTERYDAAHQCLQMLK